VGTDSQQDPVETETARFSDRPVVCPKEYDKVFPPRLSGECVCEIAVSENTNLY